MWRLTLLCVVGFFVTSVISIGKDRLYPFGRDHQDNLLPVGDDISSSEISLQVPVAFFDSQFSSIFVNLNGLLSFESDFREFKSDVTLPFGRKVIAPFYSDVDTHLTGNVYYRETQDPSLLHMAASQLREKFTGRARFSPRALFIVTWDEVGYYNQQYDKTNTYQVVIASDGRDSYVLFLYPEEGLGWIAGQGKQAPEADHPAQAGFTNGDRRRYNLLPASGQEQVIYLTVWSNSNERGVWMFRVGDLGEGEVETPDRHTPDDGADSGSNGHGGEHEGEAAGTCAVDATKCAAHAQCVDFTDGACCSCLPEAIGNGVNCLTRDVQHLRMNGHVEGTVNGQTIDNIDMHAFIVVNDGRSYVALSPLSVELGTTMKAVFSLAGGLGWLFGLPKSPKTKNGYMQSGGDLDRTMTARFLGSGEVLNIHQTYQGNLVQEQLRMTTTISGQMPNIAPGSDVTVDDYTEEFTKTGEGQMKALTTITYRVNEVPLRVEVDQTLNFDVCPFRPPNGEGALRLHVTRNFLVYEDLQKILRIAQTNRIANVVGTNPCLEASFTCDSNADCIPVRDSYRCVCKDGYRGDGQRCEDIDECTHNTHDCHERALCYNSVGTFECRCMPGYVGNGKDCRRDMTCDDLTCDGKAKCVTDAETGDPRCECNPGFTGDGKICDAVEFNCNEADICDENAECVYDRQTNEFNCECNDGYSGDGLSCADTGEPELSCSRCDAHARCVYDVDRLVFRCQCLPGFTGDGATCSRFVQTCNEADTCNENAECVRDEFGGYMCQCASGFTGDGHECTRESSDQCRSDDECDVNARCAYDAESRAYVCRCNDDYDGDGRTCSEKEVMCNDVNTCHLHANCVYEPQKLAYECRCRQGYVGDGYSCRLMADCRRDQTICDRNARCQQRGAEYVCVCNANYDGDGFRCAPSEEARTSYLMVAQGMAILEVPFHPTDDNPGRPILMIPGQTAIGIDSDCYARYFYWTDVAGRAISRAKLDGTDSEVILAGLGSPEGVAVDWVAKNLYWTDSSLDRVEVSRLDGTRRKALVTTGLVNPRSIAVDPSRGLMFWTDWDRAAPKIERAHMDGTGRTDLVSTGLGLPNGLTIDFDTFKVCWSDAGTQKVECVNYEGRGKETHYSLASYPFGLAYNMNIFYWTDWDMQSLPNINRYGGETNEPLMLPSGGNGRTYGITTVRARCPGGSNACALNNGGCRFLCLPTPNGGRTCTCPDDVDEEECNRIGQL